MKKKVSILCLCTILLCVLFLCTSCASKATAPIKLKLNSDTLQLEWMRVPGARAYEVRISGEERTKTTQANYFSLEYLAPGEYLIEVRSISADPEVEPSNWISYNFVREKESGLRFKLINNKTEYEVVGAGTATGDVVMESVYRGKPVTSIADKAFNNNKNITSLVISENVKTIGKSAFNRCSEMVSITIPESVTSIGEYAFQSCKKLTSITLPSNVTAISPYMFSWCTALSNVVMSDKVTTVGEYAFSNCENLVTMTLPDSVAFIGEYAFSDCKQLTTMNVGKGMKNIDDYAFFNCVALVNLNLGESLQTTGVGSFGNCTALESVVIPESTTSIGNETFANCSALANVDLGDKLEKIGMYAFYNTAVSNAAEDLFYLDGWVIETKNKERTNLLLAEGTYGIADAAFANCDALTSVRINGVQYVGTSAFYGCTELWEIIFDDALLVLNDAAFEGCSKLNKVKVGNSLTTMGKYVFRRCTVLLSMELPDSLTTMGANCYANTSCFNNSKNVVYVDDWVVGLKPEVYFEPIIVKEGIRGIANYSFNKATIVGAGAGVQLPSTLEIIGRGAFYMNQYTRFINLPENLRYIGDYAFYGCSQMWCAEKGVTVIPGKVEYIGRSAFYNCGAMVSLYIPSSVRTIGDWAFSGCTGLGESNNVFESEEDYKNGNALKGEVVIENGVVSIGERAFQNCIGIIEIILPESVETIGARAFYNCVRLQKAVLGENVKDVPAYAFYKCEALTEVKVSDSIRSIGDYAFRGCVKLTSIRLGKSVESVGKCAFYGCTEVTEIVLPTSLTYIDDYAFRGCVKVDSVILPESVTYIGKHAFYGLNKATFFCEAEKLPGMWNERWNSSYRTVFWGCTLSEDASYVTSWSKAETAVENVNAPDSGKAPERDGYEFAGWSVTEGSNEADYTVDNFQTVEDGVILYPVWRQKATN